MHVLPLRLTPGTDLRRALEDAAGGEGPGSAFVLSGIGSLSGAKLRLAGAATETEFNGMFEIASLSGTITPDGSHLHMVIADSTGRVFGGHVCFGNEIRTTAEILLASLPDWSLGRAPDGSTGFDELVVARGRDEPAIAQITDANPTVAEMEARVARFRTLEPTDDYVDSAIPGCERTTFRVLGTTPAAPLAAEDFHLNIVRCEAGKSAPLHSHLTQEVFVALTGRWEVFWGPRGERSVLLEPWDTIAVPPGLSRGFRNVGTELAHLMGLAGGRDPGHIDWPAQVRAAALAVGVDLR